MEQQGAGLEEAEENGVDLGSLDRACNADRALAWSVHASALALQLTVVEQPKLAALALVAVVAEAEVGGQRKHAKKAQVGPAVSASFPAASPHTLPCMPRTDLCRLQEAQAASRAARVQKAQTGCTPPHCCLQQ